ncbi:hypothetical protein CF326_g8235 [Tilletia indica]|nr:hypothetical protein CF326_g8235 [Tilletia indica]
MATSRNTKFGTHLALTTDIVMGLTNSKEYVHEVESTIYEIRNGQVDLVTVLWGRTPPAQGLYIVNQFSLSTDKTLLLVGNDPNCMRLVPDGFDGASAEGNALLPPVLAYLNGHGCVLSVDEDRRGGYVGGFVYQGKSYGWKNFKIYLRFPEGARYATWFMAPPRTLIAFEGVWEGMKDDIIEASITRISTIDAAPQSLVTALGLGQASAANKAAHIRQLRANAKAAAEAAAVGPSPTSSPAGSSSDIIPTTPTTENVAPTESGQQKFVAPKTRSQALSPSPGEKRPRKE